MECIFEFLALAGIGQCRRWVLRLERKAVELKSFEYITIFSHKQIILQIWQKFLHHSMLGILRSHYGVYF